MDLTKVYDPGDDANRAELDSHADTCVAGSNTSLLWYTDHSVSVSPFIGEYKPLKDIPIATVATAWDNPKDGSTIILVIHEALYFGNRMPYSLLCPNQLHNNGLIVNDTPQVFDSKSTHSIIIPDEVELPLKLCGVLSYLPTRKPTEQELKNCIRYDLTSPDPWNPSDALKSSLTDEGDWGPTTLGAVKRSLLPPELCYDAPNHMVSCLERLDITPVPVQVHEADVLAHEAELRHRQVNAISRDARQSIVTSKSLAKDGT
jgi:hypothetical protein